MVEEIIKAPGWPGIPASWTSSAKSGVGTANNGSSSVWFTISNGILNEIYYPHVDRACTRDLQLIVTDGKGFFSEERRDTYHTIEFLARGVPGYKIINTCKEGRYRLEKEIVTDPIRNSVLQKVRFVALKGSVRDYKAFVLLASRLGNYGAGNTAWVGNYKGEKMLFAERGDVSLALSCNRPWKKASVGFVGASDGWQDVSKHFDLTWQYNRAENGNVALTAEVELHDDKEDDFVVCVAFGRRWTDAGQRSKGSLFEGFDRIKKHYIFEWREWQKTLIALKPPRKTGVDLYRVSTSVLRTHAAKRLPGGLIASLSVPWGFSKGDEDVGGYHLVWPRDLVETAGGLLSARAWDDARKVLNYLMVIQETDGHWAQNMWLDGTTYWQGIQLDETAFPILLTDLARRKGAVKKDELANFWPMVKKAAAFIIKHGPVSTQDRWEENEGYSAFTIAVEIAALIVAADLADHCGEEDTANFFRETADAWNEQIESWIYTKDSILAKKLEVPGYYVRISPPSSAKGNCPGKGFIYIRNRPAEEAEMHSWEVVSPDALALVRFGLRSPHDQRILNTIKVIDQLLKVETPYGPCWYRYNFDGYGEHANGNPYNGTGQGRLWPLLTGERAHYEIAAGNLKEAKRLMNTIEAFANEGGMLPEQVWDTDDIPTKGLYFGKASGSAMPLVWAHAEYITLCRSLLEKRVFDMPSQTKQRYVENQSPSRFYFWSFNNKLEYLPKGKDLRTYVLAPAVVRWTTDNWKTHHEHESSKTDLNIFYVDLPFGKYKSGTKIQFTFYWTRSENWENHDFHVTIE